MKQSRVRKLNKENWSKVLQNLPKLKCEELEKVVREIVYPENK